MKRLVQGVGINDVKGGWEEKYYRVWGDMLKRCYDSKNYAEFPTYKSVYVCDEWHTLSNFRNWFLSANYVNGYVLDKDLLIPKNKVYSPNTCLFIPNEVNCIIVKQNGKGYSKLPSGKYQVQISIYGKRVYLGVFDTEEEAHLIYITYKAKVYMTIADNVWIDENPKIHLGLYRHAKNLMKDNWNAFVINNPAFYYPEDNLLIW